MQYQIFNYFYRQIYKIILSTAMGSINIQKQEIATILEMIVEQTETILTYPVGQIPQIELDIVRDNIRKLYNNYTIIDKINSQIVDRLAHDYVSNNTENQAFAKEQNDEMQASSINKEEQKSVPITTIQDVVSEIYTKTVDSSISENSNTAEVIDESQTFESQVNETIAENEDSFVDKIKSNEVEKTNIISNSEVESREIIQPRVEESNTNLENGNIAKPATIKPEKEDKQIASKATSKAKPNPAPTGNLFETSLSVADSYKDNKPSLHEKIGSSKSDNSIIQKLQNSPITDLVKSIGINDKFLFIKELFNNNGEDYNEAIQLLNNFSSLPHAFDYLEVLSQKHHWDETSSASLKLYDLIRRKFQK